MPYETTKFQKKTEQKRHVIESEELSLSVELPKKCGWIFALIIYDYFSFYDRWVPQKESLFIVSCVSFLVYGVAVSLFLVLCQVPLNRPFEPSRSPLLYIVSLPPSDLKAMHIFCRSCHSIVFVAKRRFQKPYFAI